MTAAELNSEKQKISKISAHQINRRRFSVTDYNRMGEIGILTEEDRVELIDGEIRTMSPVDAKHAAMVKRLSHLINQMVGTKYIIGVQDPVQLHDFSEPLPDISVLRWRDDFYETSHPTSKDVILLVEVANTSEKYDRNEKLPRYAAANIPEIWLLNTSKQTIWQYSTPIDGSYNQQIEHKRGATLRCQSIPGMEIELNSLFTTKHRHQ